MMTKGNLTRDQAIAIAGITAVNSVEGKNCEPTNRVGYNGACQGDDEIEWSAGVNFVVSDGDEGTLVIYYYTTASDEAYANETGDWGGIDWADRIAGYEVV